MMQFGLLYVAMAIGMPSGLASLVLQAGGPLTVLLGAVFLRERLSGRQVVGFVVAVAGLAVIAVHRSQVAALVPVCSPWRRTRLGDRQHLQPPGARTEATAPDAVDVCRCTAAVAGALLLFEGPHRDWDALRTTMTWDALSSLLGLLYIVIIATLIGYGLWNTLLSRHPSNVVAPFAMLVPVTGVLSSWMFWARSPTS